MIFFSFLVGFLFVCLFVCLFVSQDQDEEKLKPLETGSLWTVESDNFLGSRPYPPFSFKKKKVIEDRRLISQLLH